MDGVRAEALDPSWNVAPTDRVYAAAERAAREGEPAQRVLGTYRWGLVPSWAKDPSIGSRMINARAETLERKFRRALERRRCLVPADGFYEWERRDDGTKQPWFIVRADGAPMVFAGLWELWRPPGAEGDEPLRTCTIITTEANDLWPGSTTACPWCWGRATGTAGSTGPSPTRPRCVTCWRRQTPGPSRCTRCRPA